MDATRRTGLLASAGTALIGLGGCATSSPARDSLEGRLAAAVQAYDAQGDHRTGSPADIAAADWLAAEVANSGGAAMLEHFDLLRVDPRECHVGAEGRRAVLSDVRQSRHQAVVLITRGGRPGLFLLNAPAFSKPSGPPTLQVSSTHAEWLHALTRRGADVDLVGRVDRTPAKASNVTAFVRGSDRILAPIVVSTPRSAWWRCAGERGGGLACWLEAVRSLARANPRRDCHFVAFSGHELGWLGMLDYMRRRPDLIGRAHLWLHFGANVGVARQPNMIDASDDPLERWAAAAMEREGVAVNRRARRGSTPFGEAAFVHRGGGRYVALVCDNDLFHHPDDRWPDAIDVSALARYARAFSSAMVEVAAGATA